MIAGPGGSGTSLGSAGPFRSRIDGVNRLALMILGLVSTAGGILALLAGAGVFGSSVRRSAVLGSQTREFAASHGWFWLVVAVGAALVAVMSLWWLLAQFRPGHLRNLPVRHDAIGGVRVSAAALTEAVEDDVARINGVDGVRAALRDRRGPLLEIVVTLAPEARVSDVRDGVGGPVLRRARTAIGRPNLRAQVELVPGARPRRVVH